MRQRHKSDLTYDPCDDRWMVEVGGRKYGLHCGEGFSLSLGNLNLPCRLELDESWYIVLPGARLNLRPRDTYKVEF